MATLKFIKVSQQTEKAIKVIVQENGYCLKQFKSLKEKYFWIPKSVYTNLTESSVEVADWFYEKNIKLDSWNPSQLD
jgi:hypothetical protein